MTAPAPPSPETRRPVLMVDVDGVISLFGFDPDDRPPGRFLYVDGLIHFISATAGAHLRRLAASFDLVWCTGWKDRANDHLPAALELPGPFPWLALDTDPTPPTGLRPHWKLAAIGRHSRPERPLAWIDDDLDARCHAWARDRTGPTLLVETDPAVGIDAAAVERLAAWAATHGPPVRNPC